jgi:hypothetical protein
MSAVKSGLDGDAKPLTPCNASLGCAGKCTAAQCSTDPPTPVENQQGQRSVDVCAYENRHNQNHAASDAVHRAVYKELLVVKGEDINRNCKRNTQE